MKFKPVILICSFYFLFFHLKVLIFFFLLSTKKTHVEYEHSENAGMNENSPEAGRPETAVVIDFLLTFLPKPDI